MANKKPDSRENNAMTITFKSTNQEINTDEGIREALSDRLLVRGGGTKWTFPASRRRGGSGRMTDGQIGKVSVSRFYLVPVRGAEHELAVHVTFSIQQIYVPADTGMNRSPEIRIEIKNLHFTARPKALQTRLHAGSSVEARTPDGRSVSIHRGIKNDWNYEDRINDLATALSLNLPAKEALSRVREALKPFNGQALEAVRDGLKESLINEIRANLEPREAREEVSIIVNFL